MVGGALDVGESYEEAAARELSEELGVHVPVRSSSSCTGIWCLGPAAEERFPGGSADVSGGCDAGGMIEAGRARGRDVRPAGGGMSLRRHAGVRAMRWCRRGGPGRGTPSPPGRG
ncbi:NUDIX domain-containing protein [Streptomyces sp. NPDC008222]|uniref:NUDIX domain-containing protein n=1 Tax=Streptomyces sp. NPDC008222 TaxID=3364820 RepID=UPI0036F0FDA8